MANRAKQDTFLGALIGMAIGDAMGMPVTGWTAARIEERLGRVEDYLPRVLPDGNEIKAGEFTEESELALCIVESFTVNNGELDPENIGVRFLHLAKGEARRWIEPATLVALDSAADSLEFQVPLRDDGPATGDVAARGIPIGLIHAVGRFDPDALRRDVETVTRITHGNPAAISGATAVAYLVALAARGEIAPIEWAAATAGFLGQGAAADRLRELAAGHDPMAFTGDDAAAVVASALGAVLSGEDFPEVISAAVNLGGPADARGAIAGAIAGAHLGIAGIPQPLIDRLEGRIYVSLAAPWFYRTALRRAGLVIDMRSER